MDMIALLKAERDKVARQLNALDTAIRALRGLSSTRVSHGPRKMSAAARARISASQKAQRQVWRISGPHNGRDGRRSGSRKRLSYISHDCQRLLDLRGEESLRIRAAAKPIITNTPPITSTSFTGRDYLRVQRTAARNLHNQATSFARAGGALECVTQREGKAPPLSPSSVSPTTGLFSF